jgi:hypothetical protein
MEVWKQKCPLNSHGSLLNAEQEAPFFIKKTISYNNPDLIVFFYNSSTILIVHGCLNLSILMYSLLSLFCCKCVLFRYYP